MIAIACLDAKNGIGKDGKLLVSIPEDMKFFRENTKDSVVVMGRKTLFSFKDKAPLKNRINIVFTNNTELYKEYTAYDNIYFVQSVEELDKLLEKYKEKKVFLIGGEKIYRNLLDKCDTALITRLDKSFDADAFFPELESFGFSIKEQSDIFDHDGIKFRFLTYTK